MSDERHDDEIFGRALARAIETMDPNLTPFEKSRLATAPRRALPFGLWQLAGVAAMVLVVAAIGAYLVSPKDLPSAVGGSPTVPGATSTLTPSVVPATSSPTPTPAATVAVGQLDHFRVYFARDGLPPVGGHVDNAGAGQSASDRIASRLRAMQTATPPNGATNAFPNGSAVSLQGVTVNGDVATADYNVPSGDWKVRGAAAAALLQQLVYTATEEPGIRRLTLTQNGGQRTTIDQITVSSPTAREDVYGYAFVPKTGSAEGIANGGDTGGRYQMAVTTSVDTLAPGIARVVLTFKDAQGADVTAVPDFAASLDASDDGVAPRDAKYALSVSLHAAQVTTTTAGAVVDRTPLRAVRVEGSTVRIGLDDARPWRLFTLANPARIVVDIGGATTSVSDRIAVYQPRPRDTVSRDVQLTGAARVFEANVVWQLRDPSGALVASGHFLASLGSSAVWGTFDTHIQIPASVGGNVTLQLYEASAQDGHPVGTVSIPLTVR